MDAPTFTKKLTHERVIIYDLRYPEAEREAIFILLVDKAKHKAIRAALKNGDAMLLSNFGSVIYSGYENPPGDVIKYLSHEYGFKYKPCD